MIRHPRLRCPQCGSKNKRSTGTKRKQRQIIRYYRCKVCGHSFQTFEEETQLTFELSEVQQLVFELSDRIRKL